MPEGESEFAAQCIGCLSCRVVEEFGEFQIVHLNAVPTGGWVARGSGRNHDCSICGAICRGIIFRLPLELSNLPCPRCGKPGDYKYTLECVRLDPKPDQYRYMAVSFDFMATVTCAKCSAKSLFERAAISLSWLRGIKLGPFGIDFDFYRGRKDERIPLDLEERPRLGLL